MLGLVAVEHVPPICFIPHQNSYLDTCFSTLQQQVYKLVDSRELAVRMMVACCCHSRLFLRCTRRTVEWQTWSNSPPYNKNVARIKVIIYINV